MRKLEKILDSVSPWVSLATFALVLLSYCAERARADEVIPAQPYKVITVRIELRVPDQQAFLKKCKSALTSASKYHMTSKEADALIKLYGEDVCIDRFTWLALDALRTPGIEVRGLSLDAGETKYLVDETVAK